MFTCECVCVQNSMNFDGYGKLKINRWILDGILNKFIKRFLNKGFERKICMYLFIIKLLLIVGWSEMCEIVLSVL